MSEDRKQPEQSLSTDAPDGPVSNAEKPPEVSRQAEDYVSSRHSRLVDEISRPLERGDPREAAALCAEITRRLLLDFAPALTLLSGTERHRVQALATYAFTLFDFARQGGRKLGNTEKWHGLTMPRWKSRSRPKWLLAWLN